MLHLLSFKESHGSRVDLSPDEWSELDDILNIARDEGFLVTRNSGGVAIEYARGLDKQVYFDITKEIYQRLKAMGIINNKRSYIHIWDAPEGASEIYFENGLPITLDMDPHCAVIYFS